MKSFAQTYTARILASVMKRLDEGCVAYEVERTRMENRNAYACTLTVHWTDYK